MQICITWISFKTWKRMFSKWGQALTQLKGTGSGWVATLWQYDTDILPFVILPSFRAVYGEGVGDVVVECEVVMHHTLVFTHTALPIAVQNVLCGTGKIFNMIIYYILLLLYLSE